MKAPFPESQLGVCPSAAGDLRVPWRGTHHRGQRGRERPPSRTPCQESPLPTSLAGLPSAELCWDAGSRDRKVPSSDTWDFSVSLSMPGGAQVGVRTPAQCLC